MTTARTRSVRSLTGMALSALTALVLTGCGAGGDGSGGGGSAEATGTDAPIPAVAEDVRLAAREVGDALVFTDDGRIVESGDPRAVLSDPQEERTRAFLSTVL
ncbi:hypothetical protein WHI96_00590 [Pseudonocardia tropica]|uniref:ABC transporter substrate-binding protein n=1 Tax=Pseudonocardia tropica TaxID=681289 RepID=A0ABV1JMZ4_9PSEU